MSAAEVFPIDASRTLAGAHRRSDLPKKLLIAGTRLTPRTAQQVAKRVTDVDFGLKRVMSLGMMRVVIALMKFFKPGKKEDLMPMWVGMQYGYCMALGVASPGARCAVGHLAPTASSCELTG
jgi:hypothetical protein